MVQSKAVPQNHIWLGLSLATVGFTAVYLSWQWPQILQLLDPASLPTTLDHLGLWGPFLYIAIITISVVIS